MIEATITDITVMRQTRVCIAALTQGRQIRLDDPNPTEEWVRQMSGLHPGSVIRLDWKPAAGATRPHVEDGTWVPQTCRKVGEIVEAELASILDADAYDSVTDAYGEPMILGKQGSCAFHPGRGSHSLTSIRVPFMSLSAPWDPQTEKVRVRFRDEASEWKQVPLQDLMVNEHLRRCRTCSKDPSVPLGRDFPDGPALLRVGLARAEALGTYPPACWLQVNHVFRRNSSRRHFI